MADDERFQILQDDYYLLQEECAKLQTYVNELETEQNSLLKKENISDNGHDNILHEFVADLFDNPLHSDLKILLNGGKEIYAHKLILASREFISQDRNLSQLTGLDLSDRKFETVYKMFRWIYTDKLDNVDTEEEFSDLLQLAHEFHLQTLISRCTKAIDNLINKNINRLFTQEAQKSFGETQQQHVSVKSEEKEVNQEKIGIDDEDDDDDDDDESENLDDSDNDVHDTGDENGLTPIKSDEKTSESKAEINKGNNSNIKPKSKEKRKPRIKILSVPKISSSSNKCDVCGRSYPTHKQLLYHSKIHTENKDYKCDVCNKSFYCASHLKQHLRVHSGLKPYQCDVCGATFKQSGGLYSHRSIHTGDKPFRCDVCDKIFRQKSALTLHQRTHTGEKTYICEYCGKAFSTKSKLSLHKRSHTGERPAVCETCNKSFISTNHLKRHIKTHTGEKTFKCGICEKSFTNGYNLRRHIQTHKNRGTVDVCYTSSPLNLAI